MQRGNMAHIIKKMLDDLYNEGTDPEEIKSGNPNDNAGTQYFIMRGGCLHV